MEKKCYLCGRKKVFDYLGRLICDKCFVRVIEKRVKKSLGRVFSKGDEVLVVGALANYFLRAAIKNLPLKISVRKKIPLDTKRYKKIIVEETLDDEVVDFLNNFFSKSFKVKKENKIKILKAITDEEALRFAKIKGIDFKPKKKDAKIMDFLKKISKKHPEVRYNLLKNVRELEKILK